MPLHRVKKMVKIGTVVLAENILIEITLPVHVVVRRIMSNISGCNLLDRFSLSFQHIMKTLYVTMMDLYHIFQFVKRRCHGNQKCCGNEGKQILWHSLLVRQMVARFHFSTTYY